MLLTLQDVDFFYCLTTNAIGDYEKSAFPKRLAGASYTLYSQDLIAVKGVPTTARRSIHFCF
jgi:hypothetical protein